LSRTNPVAGGRRVWPRARRTAAALAAVALAGSVCTASAQWREWDADFDEGRKEWKEIEARIPAYPRDADLIRFAAGGVAAHRYHIDARSLSVGEDGVVRYTLVVKAAGGATNVTFEGIRCEERERKIYAVGHPDGNWARARSPQWRRIDLQDADPIHRVLYTEYLCDGRWPVRNEREVLRKFRYPMTDPAGG